MNINMCEIIMYEHITAAKTVVRGAGLRARRLADRVIRPYLCRRGDRKTTRPRANYNCGRGGEGG